ncbi:MAG: glycoside hydrolase family 2 protein, partial [Hymenobacter sp.]|nr:glycoside hydrolase family 2 protein [Hymenobacter sp.]
TYDVANPTSRGGGYLPGGVGWYRKQFVLPQADAGRRVSVEFDGVMANSEVWINGFLLGKRPYGYSSFAYDLTGHLKYGPEQPNVLAVRADNTIQPASRYYTGAGIYRHVRLVSTNAVHFELWGVQVSTPQVSASQATVKVQAQVMNQAAAAGSYTVETTLLDPAGKTVKTVQTTQPVPAGQAVAFTLELPVARPQRWGIEQPVLYKAVTRIRAGKTMIDELTMPFGIREAKFEAATGFWLNGQNMKIKGVCLHHDAGALGAAVPLQAWERRLKLLRQVGVNGIRTAHNPVAPEFLDLCDRLGFVVLDETFDTWTEAKNHGEQGYNLNFTEWWPADTRALVLRDRNHPSVVLYSVGNEIHDNLNSPTGFKQYKDQQDLMHQLDPTRPVTMALFRPGQSKVYENGFVETMDVVGQNYRENELVAAHQAKPARKVIGTENTHTLTAWLALRDNPFMAGQFLWTGFDYLGEADWPKTTNGQGLFDRAGGWRPLAYQRQSWWATQPVVHIVRNEENAGAGALVANWTPTDFDTYDAAKVNVYSNCDEVELFLNGKSLGAKPKPADDAPRTWDVTFAKGTLRAVARNKGKEVATDELKTAGEPARIILATDHPTLATGWDEVAYITARVVDANGVLCPNTDKLLTFSLTGPGVVAAVDNGNIASHESYRGLTRQVYQGQCIAILKAQSPGGKITLKASSPGLTDGTVTLEAALLK